MKYAPSARARRQTEIAQRNDCVALNRRRLATDGLSVETIAQIERDIATHERMLLRLREVDGSDCRETLDAEEGGGRTAVQEIGRRADALQERFGLEGAVANMTHVLAQSGREDDRAVLAALRGRKVLA